MEFVALVQATFRVAVCGGWLGRRLFIIFGRSIMHRSMGGRLDHRPSIFVLLRVMSISGVLLGLVVVARLLKRWLSRNRIYSVDCFSFCYLARAVSLVFGTIVVGCWLFVVLLAEPISLFCVS